MKESRLIKICEYLCKLIEEKEAASEDLMSDYISEMAKSIQKSTKRQDFSYYELVDRCRQYQTYQLEDKERFAYMMGSIRGAADLGWQIRQESDLQAYEEKILSPSSVQFLALRVISQNPGISRQELINLIPGDRSSSALSHLTGLLKKEQYISFQRIGQEKRFFATPRGDEYVHAVLKQEALKAEQEYSAACESNFIPDIAMMSRLKRLDYGKENSDYLTNDMNWRLHETIGAGFDDNFNSGIMKSM